MACAHWQALQALDSAGVVSSLRDAEDAAQVALSLALCISRGPPTLAADEALQRLFARMLQRLGQVRFGS